MCVCVCVCVCNTLITDLVEEKRIEYSQFDLMRTFIYKGQTHLDGTKYINQYGLSCVSQLSQEEVILFHIGFPNLKSSFVHAAIWNFVLFSYVHKRTQTVRGQKGGGNSAWNRKGFSSLRPFGVCCGKSKVSSKMFNGMVESYISTGRSDCLSWLECRTRMEFLTFTL